MRLSTRLAALAASVALTAGLAACGSSGSTAKATSSGSGKAVATYGSLTGTATTVTLTGTFLSKLTALGLAPTASAPATLGGGKITFPITGGNATVHATGSSPQLTGTVRHSGGIALTTRGQKVQLTDFVLALGAKPTLTGTVLINGTKLGSSGITMFDLDTSTMSAPTTSGGATTLSGATVYVDASAATALNAAFGLTGTSKALPTGTNELEVGTATITLRG